MTTHYLDNWKQYLSTDDYNYLIQYIENIKNNIQNDKMIILSGPGSSGKSTLAKPLAELIGGVWVNADQVWNTPFEWMVPATHIKHILGILFGNFFG